MTEDTPFAIVGAGGPLTGLTPGVEHHMSLGLRDTQLMLQNLRARSFRRLKALHRLARNAPRAKTVLFVTGCHRSGTNMVMEMLDRSWATEVFHEADDSMFDEYIMREDAAVRHLVERSTARLVVIKALHEAHMLSRLLDLYRPAKAIWVIRDFDAVIISMIRHWPDWTNKIDELVKDRSAADWRGLGMTDHTYRIVKGNYKPQMSAAAASALFWYYRNQLFFDQNLSRDDRVLLIKYEDIVRQAPNYGRRLTNFLGIEVTRSMQALPRVSHVLPQDRAVLPGDVRALCEGMQARLSRAYSECL